tara:strand:- start:414 stop:3182 length:2769 start_codon:yes stop_codon:yes gene_type:complete
MIGKDGLENQKNINKTLNETKNIQGEMADGLRSYTDMMKDVNRLTGKKINLDTEVQSQLNKLTSATTKLYQQQEGMTRLTDKQLDKESEKARIAIAEVKILAQSISKKTNLSNLESELLATMDDKFQRENGILEQVEEQVKARKQANKAMGVAGGLLKGLTDLSPQFAKALKIDEVANDMQTFADKTAEAGGKVSKLKTLAVGAKSAFNNLFSTLTDPTVVIGAMVKGFLSVDKAQTAFKRQTGQTVDMIDTMNSELLLSSEYIAASTELTKELGMNASAVFNQDDITEVALMTKQIGLSTKEANSLAMQSKMHGMSVEDNNKAVFAGVNAMNKQNGSAINARKVLDDVSNVSEEIAISYSGYPGELAAAATAAASLGMNLSQVDKIAGSLLNFESSIQAEMEAELLTGKSLNLEKARQLALDNDLAGVANELANQGITMASFGAMNRIQQEAQAKAMGMSKQEMSKMLMMKEMEGELDRESLSAAGKQQYDEIKSLEVQEQFNTAIGKLQEALAPVVGFFASILSHSVILYPLIAAIGTVMAVKMAKSAVSFASSMGDSVRSSMTLVKNLGSSGSLMGKMYKGGQFMPGGGRAAAGGQRAGGLMGKIKGAFSAPKGLDKGAKAIAGSADKTKGIDPKQGSGIEKFLKGLGNGLASIGQQAGKVFMGGVALGAALLAMAGGLALAMPMIAGSDPVLMLAFAGSISAIGLTVALMGKVGTEIIKGALAMSIMAGALIPAAIAFSLLAGVDANSILAFSIAIPILGLSVMALGLIFTNPITMFLFGAGILGLVSLGAAIIPLATAFGQLGDTDVAGTMAGFSQLASMAPSLSKAASGLYDLAGGLAAVGLAGILALPVLSTLMSTGLLGGGGGSGGGESKKDSGMEKVNKNLEKLISLVEAGGDVFIDGSKVGKSMQLSSSTMG